MADAPAITRAALRSVAGIGVLRARAGLLAALHAEFADAAPTTPGFVAAGDLTLACLAPNRYLASGPREAGLPARLAHALADLAAVTDQSDMWAIFIVSGPHTQERLSRIVPVDLGPAQFPPGSLALTRAGHLDVRVCRTADATYEVSTVRSCGDDLQVALQEGLLF